MAHVSSFAHTSNRSVFGALSAMFTNAYTAYVEARAIEKTYAELDALSDRELADIGLNRGTIFEAAMTSGRQA
ncbi:MAG: hypothetical protein ACJAYH_000971 [Celeribacter sp.]|jgi:uncharacterized protein YjiS (DUF1127 family)